jgi:hypothetical protein
VSNALGAVLFFASLSSDEFCLAHLDQQLAWHRKYGLPPVPPQAALVWCITEPMTYYVDAGRKKVINPGEPVLGFSLDGRTLFERSNHPHPVASITVIKPDPALLRTEVHARWLEIAVACHERGWKELALESIRRWSRANEGWDTEDQIARDAWHYWVYQLRNDPGTPLPLVAKYLKLAAQMYALGDAKLARSVELAVRPRNSPPGSADALIDELVELTGEEPFFFWAGRGFRADPRYRAIVQRGLDIVPALIAHLDDDRATRAVRRPQRIEIEQLRIRDLAFDVLAQLHGRAFVLEEDTLDERLRVIGKWFADAHKLGEVKYVVSRILGVDEKDDEFRAVLFDLLAEKYPQHLPGVFRALIDERPNHHVHAWNYAKAIADAPLPPADKRKIFEYAAIQEQPTLRAAGIYYLRPFDPKMAKGLLLLGLAQMPVVPDVSETHLAGIVAEGTDPDEWRALGLAVRRAEVGARIRMLAVIARKTTPAGRKHRIAFLAEYLRDDELRDAEGFNDRFLRLEVRNAAAMRLAQVLELPAEPDLDWTPAQWAALRTQVRARAHEELQR